MKVQLNVPWTDKEQVRHDAGAVIDMDSSGARRLTNCGVASEVSISEPAKDAEKSIGAKKNKMIDNDHASAQDKELTAEQLHPGLSAVKKRKKAK